MELDDPRLVTLRSAFASHTAARVERGALSKESAVALVLRAHEDLELLLIKRAERESDPWSGHMALPGGRRSVADEDLVATALRETLEEVGVDVARTGRLIGALDEIEPGTRRLPPLVIAPFVAAVPAGTTATPDPREVEAALWVPLASLRDESAVDELVLELETGPRAYPALRHGEHLIWGLTHRILVQFLEIARTAGL